MSTVTYVGATSGYAATSSNNMYINAPAHSSGDLLLAVICPCDDMSDVTNIPAGWTLLSQGYRTNTTGGYIQVWLYYMWATSTTDGGGYWYMSSSNGFLGSIAAYSGVVSIGQTGSWRTVDDGTYTVDFKSLTSNNGGGLYVGCAISDLFISSQGSFDWSSSGMTPTSGFLPGNGTFAASGLQWGQVGDFGNGAASGNRTVGFNYSSYNYALAAAAFMLQGYAAPAAATNLSPNGTTVNGATTNRLSWTYNSSIAQTSFRLEYSLNGGAVTTITQNTSNPWYDVPGGAIGSGSVAWWVFTSNSTGEGPISATAHYTNNYGPSVPTPQTPINGTVESRTRSYFSWRYNNQSGAAQAQYELKWRRDDALSGDDGTAGYFTTGLVSQSVAANGIGQSNPAIGDSNWTPGKYYWTVRAIDTTGYDSGFCTEAYFFVQNQTGDWYLDPAQTSANQSTGYHDMDQQGTGTVDGYCTFSLGGFDTCQMAGGSVGANRNGVPAAGTYGYNQLGWRTPLPVTYPSNYDYWEFDSTPWRFYYTLNLVNNTVPSQDILLTWAISKADASLNPIGEIIRGSAIQTVQASQLQFSAASGSIPAGTRVYQNERLILMGWITNVVNGSPTAPTSTYGVHFSNVYNGQPYGLSIGAGTGTYIRGRTASMSVAVTSTLTASGMKLVPGASTMPATSSLTASGTVTRQGVATLSAASSLSATGLVTAQGQASLVATSQFIPSATPTSFATANLQATSSMTDAGTVTRFGSGSLSAASTMTVSSQNNAVASASLVGTSTLAAESISGQYVPFLIV